MIFMAGFLVGAVVTFCGLVVWAQLAASQRRCQHCHAWLPAQSPPGICFRCELDMRNIARILADDDPPSRQVTH